MIALKGGAKFDSIAASLSEVSDEKAMAKVSLNIRTKTRDL